ncbi:unnamed protein product [Acanthoscelides obtectus]|uniref:Uncharacterized protein n=1 Tax=Acanthoscelides obtectus TaxID=200917 RepID=A0A9P0K6Q1_ACAOB|nr:unnamed protein product [Acanthoscelides obtectus]CAK1683126.1 hypothetical protein AOBTE_LOCUS34095 [Acanthoscelides obtectus]
MGRDWRFSGRYQSPHFLRYVYSFSHHFSGPPPAAFSRHCQEQESR